MTTLIERLRARLVVRGSDIMMGPDRDPLCAEAADEIERLIHDVREWCCEKCNTVYPGPPQLGLLCVICPKCSGNTMPYPTWERRKIQQECAQFRSKNESLEMEIERLNAALKVADQIAHQLMYRDHPELLGAYWKARGDCTVCLPGTSGGNK
jgi:hypothetical protein